MSNDDDLYRLLPKVKRLPPTEEEKRKKAQDTLREFFRTYHKSRRGRLCAEVDPKYSLFLWPAPILSVYRKGDEENFKVKTFTSLRVAKRVLMKEIMKYKSECWHRRTIGDHE